MSEVEEPSWTVVVGNLTLELFVASTPAMAEWEGRLVVRYATSLNNGGHPGLYTCLQRTKKDKG